MAFAGHFAMIPPLRTYWSNDNLVLLGRQKEFYFRLLNHFDTFSSPSSGSNFSHRLRHQITGNPTPHV